MEITITNLLFITTMLGLLLDGIVAEGITVISLAAAILLERNRVRQVIKKKYYRACVFFVVSFIVLFFIHIAFLGQKRDAIIRLYGLTKNICFPALMVMAFGYVCADGFPFRVVMIEMTIFNLVYIAAIMTGTDLEEISFRLGSLNGCSGIDVVLLPAALVYLKSIKMPRTTDPSVADRSLPAYAFIITAVVMVAVSESSTSILLLIAEVLACLFFVIIYAIRVNKNFKGVILVGAIGVIGIFLLIASGVIKVDPNALKTRAGIWTRAFHQFIDNKGLTIVFGTGDDTVHMLTKDLEPHNMFLEILLIHGVIGLLFIILFIVCTLKMLLKTDRKRIKPLLLCFVIYLAVCCLHPFFTGVTPFQFNCMTGLLFLLMTSRSKQIDIVLSRLEGR